MKYLNMLKTLLCRLLFPRSEPSGTPCCLGQRPRGKSQPQLVSDIDRKTDILPFIDMKLDMLAAEIRMLRPKRKKKAETPNEIPE